MSKSPRLLLLTLSVAVVQGLFATATTMHRVFFGTMGRGGVYDDVTIYYRYASKAMAGAVPYRDYLVEYPVFAFPVFLLPRLVAPSYAGYEVAFGLEMLLANAATLLLVASEVERAEGARRVPARLAWYTLFFASMCPLVVCRFDLAAMAMAFAAACAWYPGRPGLGGTLAGVGTLIKIFPGLVAVPAFVGAIVRWREERRLDRGMVFFAATLCVGTAFWFVLGGEKVRNALGYHAFRGVEIGSLYSGLLMLQAKATGATLMAGYANGSVEVNSNWSSMISTFGFPAQVLSLLLVMWRFRRAGSDEPIRYAAAAIIAFLLFGKVLSPQYLIWLFPFIAVIRDRTGIWARGLFLMACVVTTLLFPMAFKWLIMFEGWAVGLLICRNALLLVLWTLLVIGPPARPARGPTSGPVIA